MAQIPVCTYSPTVCRIIGSAVLFEQASGVNEVEASAQDYHEWKGKLPLQSIQGLGIEHSCFMEQVVIII